MRSLHELLVYTLDVVGEPVSAELADELDHYSAQWDVIKVADLKQDSRQVTPGDVFFALQGEKVSGETFIDSAIASGASAIFVGASSGAGVSITKDKACPVFRIPSLAENLTYVAAYFYDVNLSEVATVAVTGTNGKTSVASLLAQLYGALGHPAGVIGTLGYGVVDEGRLELKETGFTTPQAVAAQRCLQDLVSRGCKRVVMEVSSHALAQQRVDAVPYKLALLTNITRDHLDFHGDMSAYVEAKARLLSFASLSSVVINLDDPVVKSLAGRVSSKVTVYSYSTTDSQATVYSSDVRYCHNGVRATLHIDGNHFAFYSPLLGEFNLSNSLAACAALLAEGYLPRDIVDLFASVQPVPGRMQRVQSASGCADIQVVVDYAHTPDALKAVLLALRQHSDAHLVCVFGCGGNRDRGKRSQMGAIAQAYADKIYLTSDNPRDEDPKAIIEAIQSGTGAGENIVVELDRRKAIDRAIAEADAGDLVLIAGKGHETVQLIKGQELPFDDAEIARAALQARMAA